MKDKFFLSADDIKQYQHIPSVRYHERVAELRKFFDNIDLVESSAVFIIMNNGERIWLSLAPAMTVAYANSGFVRGDTLFERKNLMKNKVIFEREFGSMDQQQLAVKALRKEYGIHQVYAFCRQCTDCAVVTTCNATVPPTDVEQFYQETITDLENWVIYCLDNALDIFCEALPSLAKTRFASDSHFRQLVIQTRETLKKDALSPKETEVLYWSAQGKTAAEIAMIIGLTEETVNTYRKRCLKKLHASNITQAIYLAQVHGLIA